MLEVIDDFLNPQDYGLIRDTLLGGNFPWFYTNLKVRGAEDSLYNMQFTHMFVTNNAPQSDFLDVVNPLIIQLRPVSVIRIKANLTPPTPTIYHYGMHVAILEQQMPAKTAVYYVNDNNGLTVFEDGREVNSVANRLVIFDASMRHTGTSCTDVKQRCVINLNFK